MLLTRAVVDGRHFELRARRRYAIRLRVVGRVLYNDPHTIAGITENISTTGMLLAVSGAAPQQEVRLWIEWPVKSPLGEPLHLRVRGLIIWTKGELAGLVMKDCKLTTGALPPQS